MTTQLDASVGLAKEATYGTGVVASAFVEFTSESLVWEPTFAQGAGLRVGSRVARSGRRALVKQQASGDIELELVTKGIGKLLEALFGTATSTAVVGQTGVFQQLFTPTLGQLPSYTVQKGLPLLGGAAQPMTFRGGVCTSGEFTAALADIVKLKTSWNFKDMDTATAYAAPSYAAGADLFTFVQGAITVGGTVTPPGAATLASGGTVVANVVDFSLSWDNKIDDGGFTFGSGGKRGRRPEVGLAEGKGKITAEYTDNVLRDAYLAQSPLAMVLTFTVPVTIGASANPVLQITIPLVKLEGEIPKANGGSVVQQSIDYTVLDGLTAGSPLYVALVTTDTAI